MPDLQVLGSAETDELAENVQHFHVPATIVYQYYDHPFQIIHVNTVLDIAFRHLPPNSARFSYAPEGALFISAQLSSDAVSAL